MCVCWYWATLHPATSRPLNSPPVKGQREGTLPGGISAGHRLWDSRKRRRVDRGDSAWFWSHPKRNFCHFEWPRGGPGCPKGQGVFHLNSFASRAQMCTFLSFAVPSKPKSWHRASPPADTQQSLRLLHLANPDWPEGPTKGFCPLVSPELGPERPRARG